MYVTKQRTALQLFRSTWGLLDTQGGRFPFSRIDDLLDSVKADGYDGIEIPCTMVMRIGKSKFRDALERRKMGFIGIVFTSGGGLIVPNTGGLASPDHVAHPPEGRTAAAHVGVFAAQVRELTTPNLRHLLRSVTSHSGRDYFSFEESHEFLRSAVLVERECGVQVNHETHRGRLFHSPWDSPRLLERHPDVRLCADLSHWHVVSEAPASDPELERAVAAILPRVRHIHARVGHEQGPQVPSIAGPQWGPYLQSYLRWWDRAMAYAGRNLLSDFTLTPEFGPPPYAWTTGLTGEALPGFDLDGVNHSVALECQKLWQSRYGADSGGRLKVKAWDA